MNETQMTWDELLALPFAIHIVNGESSDLLLDTKSHFEMTDAVFYRMMRATHHQLVEKMAELDIDYKSLRNALTPSSRRHEAAFIFNSRRAGHSYGYDIANAWIPALPQIKGVTSLNAILQGDIVGVPNDDLKMSLEQHLVKVRDYSFVSSELFYCVYITNLSKTQLESMHIKLQNHAAYLGYADCSSSNELKDALGIALPQLALRVGTKVLMPVFDDVPNAAGYPFEEHGFNPVGVGQEYYLPFLSYRIESRLSGRTNIDTALSFNTLSESMNSLRTMEVTVSPERLIYLMEDEHKESIAAAGLLGLDATALSAQLREKIERGYIYNLRFKKGTKDVRGETIPWPDNDALMFNVRPEFPDQHGALRPYTVAMKYNPKAHAGEIVTFYP